MKKISLIVSILISLISLTSYAQDHVHHAKHNMVLFGQPGAFYVSHIVYKVPHNYQVILKVQFDESIESKIFEEMKAYPKEQFIYLLDHMNIGEIQKQPSLSGQILRRVENGAKKIIFDQVYLKSDDYNLIYFDELPLSLLD